MILKPIDAEWALAQDLQTLTGIRATATSEQTQGHERHIQVTQVGISTISPVAWHHFFAIDVWAGDAPDYADVWDAALTVTKALGSLDVENLENDWHSPDVTNLYANPSASFPDVPRVTIKADLIIRGE
jgi:hypothetical protein